MDQAGIGINKIEKYMKFFGFASSTGIVSRRPHHRSPQVPGVPLRACQTGWGSLSPKDCACGDSLTGSAIERSTSSKSWRSNWPLRTRRLTSSSYNLSPVLPG